VQPRSSDPLHIKAPAHHRPAGPHVTVVQPERFLAPCLDRCDANTVHCLDQVTVEEVWMALALALDVTSSDAAGEPINSLGFADNGSS